MQNIFTTTEPPSSFAEKNETLFPKAPEKCPIPSCGMPVQMKKHGFYERYIISREYCGYIHIRRYYCACCGHTLSYLPSFAIPYFQYAVCYILGFLDGFFRAEKSLRQYVFWFKKKNGDFSRRHFRYYIDRLFRNRKLIQYFLNLSCQGMIPEEDALNSQMFAKEFLQQALILHPHNFSCRFHNTTGKSILAPN